MLGKLILLTNIYSVLHIIATSSFCRINITGFAMYAISDETTNIELNYNVTEGCNFLVNNNNYKKRFSK